MPTSRHVGVHGIWRVAGSRRSRCKDAWPDIVDEDVAGVTLLEAGTFAGLSPLVRGALRLLPGEFRR